MDVFLDVAYRKGIENNVLESRGVSREELQKEIEKYKAELRNFILGSRREYAKMLATSFAAGVAICGSAALPIAESSTASVGEKLGLMATSILLGGSALALSVSGAIERNKWKLDNIDKIRIEIEETKKDCLRSRTSNC